MASAMLVVSCRPIGLMKGTITLPFSVQNFKMIEQLNGCYGRTGDSWDLSLTHWGRDKMAANILTTFSNAFSWMKTCKFRLRFHLSLFTRVQLTIFQHWPRQWLGAGQATSHYLNQWMLSLLTRPEWVKVILEQFCFEAISQGTGCRWRCLIKGILR